MPRGRPRKNQRQQELPKNPLPVIKDFKTEQVETKTNPMTEINTSSLPTKEIFSSSKKKKEDDTPLCVCCKEPVYSGRRLNLSLLTTLASYHFAVEEMQPYICSRCASDLGEVINKWLIKHGAEVKPYYKPEYMAKNYDAGLSKNLREDNSNG